MVTPPGEVLDQARAAAKAGDYARALAAYEHFFDRALLDQGPGHNYYGVRLSYCLSEWARLGDKYPAARERLELKAEKAVDAFEVTGELERFRDYIAIQSYLNREELALSRFIGYHHSRQDLARTAVGAVWNRLVEAKRWDICSAYLDDFETTYQNALYVFEQTMKVCIGEPSLGGPDLAEQIKGRYARDVGNLVAALRNTGRSGTALALEERVATDMNSRGYPELIVRVMARAAL